MVNRYDAKPDWLVMTCRGEGEREDNNQGGLIVFDVQKQDCEPYSQEACRQAAERNGLAVGGAGHAFAGSYNTKGCYSYSSGSYQGHVYYGTGGTPEQEQDSQVPDSNQFRPSGWDECPTSNAEKPQYVNHWHGPTSVEGQAAHGNHLFTVDMEGRLHVFKNFFSTTSADSEIRTTAHVQSSSRSLSHLTTWTDRSGKLYGIASTGFSWTWPDQSCSSDKKNNYRCGWATGAEPWALNSFLDNSKPEDHFDGVVIFDLSNLDQPREVSRVCLKTKCTEGVSVFFDDSNQAYATVGGVNSEFIAIVDLSNPEQAHVTTQVHKDHLNQLVPFYGIHPDTPGYETFANSGLTGGISVWNVKNPEAPVESAQLDEVDCSFANGAIFWNERYLLTPLASPVYGGACLFDMCEVNKPRFRSYVHFETLSMLTGDDPRTTYGMNAYQDYAYFALQHQNELYTMEIDLDKVYNHIVDDNSDIEYFETDSVYLNGYNATSCDVGPEYSEAERLNIMIIGALAVVAIALCVCCCFCYCCCCRRSNSAPTKQVQMTQMAGAGAAAAAGGVIVVHQAPEVADAGCCCCCWEFLCGCLECCSILNDVFGD